MSLRPATVSATTSGRSGSSTVVLAETVSRMIFALKTSDPVSPAALASDPTIGINRRQRTDGGAGAVISADAKLDDLRVLDDACGHVGQPSASQGPQEGPRGGWAQFPAEGETAVSGHFWAVAAGETAQFSALRRLGRIASFGACLVSCPSTSVRLRRSR
jgi:hypothetical protein